MRVGELIHYLSDMWLTRSKGLVLAVVLAVMPLQGVAATLSVVLCRGETQLHAVHASAGPEQDASQDGERDVGGTPGGFFNLCCHGTVSASSAVVPAVAAPEAPIRALAQHIPHDLYIPEQPQRPPLV
jgi:hypothetical protein